MSDALSAAQKKHLRKLGHALEPVVQIGKSGLTEPVLAQIAAQLEAHELIKVKYGQNAPVDAKTGAPELEARSESQVVQQMGRVVMLYKEATKDPQIRLPK